MKPWAKLWRKESPRFRALPLAARAMAGYLLKHVDSEGGLPLGGRSPTVAVAIAVGADAGERRWLRSAVQALIDHGYLVVVDGDLVVRNFPKYQDDSDARATRTEHERDANGARTRRERNMNTTRTEHERDARIDPTTRKETTAQSVLSSEKREERRENVEQSSALTRFEDSFGASALPLDERIEMHHLERLFSELRSAAGYGTWKRPGGRGYDVLCAQVTWANDPAQGATRAERFGACREAFLGWLMCDRESVAKARWPLIWLEDMGAARSVYLAAQPRPVAPENPIARMRRERSELSRLHGTGAFLARPQADRIASIERLEALEREIATAESVS